MEKFEDLKAMLETLHTDFEKFYVKGQNAAGTRIRKGMQELKNLAQDIRVDVQSIKNERTAK